MLIALLYDEVFMHADMDVGRLVRSRLKKRINTSSIQYHVLFSPDADTTT